MGTSIIDGTVEEATLKRAKAGISIFNTIRFRLDDGSTRTIKKAVTTQDVATALTPGTRARYYLYTTFDLKGVHGARFADGGSVYGFPGTNQKLFLLLIVINLLWIGLKVAVDGAVPFLGVGLLILGVVGYVLMGKGAREAQEQFDADSGYAGAPGAEAIPAGILH